MNTLLNMHISGIFVYPVKSLGGIALSESLVEARGLAFDRRWVIVDEEGIFLTQRELPQMALLQPVFADARTLQLINRANPKQAPLSVDLYPDVATDHREVVQIWDDTCNAVFVDEAADKWLSQVLGTPCRLAYMPDDSIRPVDAKYGREGDKVSFADGYPCLIIGQASLDDLNNRLHDPVPMNRFRPNIVFEGGGPHEEDQWHSLRIGEVDFRSVKPCARCEMTTINQDSSQRGKEPLATLAQYRRNGHKVLFGMNLCPDNMGVIRVGDLLIANFL